MGNNKSKSSLEPRAQPSQQREDEGQEQHQKASMLPENIDYILADDADPEIDKSSLDKLYDKLSSSGIFLANKTQKFWLNNKLNCNCFMLYARALQIAWESDPDFWKWEIFQESSKTSIEVAELIRVCWLDVSGSLDTRKLTPGVMYGVSFHVKLKNSAQYSWSVNVSLKLEGVKYKEHKMNLSEMLKGTWMEIPVAQFVAPPHDHKAREMKFCLWDHDDFKWKRGLIVKGVSIKPL